ncbi:MAG: YtxH domain-containing protein [Candidatus Riflebacteria bacterium]|nr:YtxH domain-containing protein [Candidatus Riflebacteria bacterium]
MSLTIGNLTYPAIGAVAGYLYYYFVGCPSGACPITANPYTSTVYGLIIGIALSAGK